MSLDAYRNFNFKIWKLLWKPLGLWKYILKKELMEIGILLGIGILDMKLWDEMSSFDSMFKGEKLGKCRELQKTHLYSIECRLEHAYKGTVYTHG